VNTEKEIILPFYAKATIFSIGLFSVLIMLYIAQNIIIPIIFAIIIAVVLHPVVNFFTGLKINRIIAIIITLALTFLVIYALGALLFSQAVRFSKSWPVLVDKFTSILNQSINWSSGYFNINPKNIHEWITKTISDLFNISSSGIGQTLLSVGSGVIVLFLVPVYIFMILIYQPLLIEFIRRIFGITYKKNVNEIITETKKLIQHYIIGLFFEAVIVAVLYSTGLLIIGIDYAILLGFIAALLNIIPYIGGIIAVLFMMIIALATKNTVTYPLLVGGLAVIIHIIDNSFIIPKIVASKVKINALISITAIIASSTFFGIPGMIICIPVIGIIKLILDHIEPLKPWGFLLGDTMPVLLKIKPVLKLKKKST